MVPIPTETNFPVNTFSVLGTLSLLTPWDVIGSGKLRIGGESDGGYVLLDRLRREQPVLSYGVGLDSSFDFDLAQRGHRVFMFDHTVDGPCGRLPKGCVFIREGVAAKADPKKKMDTVLAHLRRYRLASRRDVILKMDIEGGEWDIIAALPEKAMNVFEQIVVEFHWLENLKRDGFTAQVRAALQHLNESFTLCHVHANVHGGLRRPAGVVLPNVLEATYVRSDLISRKPNRTFYPTEHDRTNRPGSKDIVLSMYPFVPMVVPPSAFAPLARRLDAEHAATLAAQAPTPKA
jgi:hypothetical protein